MSLHKLYQVQYLNNGSVAWSPDGTRIASTTPYHIDVWSAKSGAAIRTMMPSSANGRKCFISSIAWSPDCALLASGGTSCCVNVWSATHRVVHRLEHDAWINCVAWSANGLWIASGTHLKIYLWSAKTGQQVCILHEQVMCVAWSPDGTRLASGTSTHLVCIRKIALCTTSQECRTLHVLREHVEQVHCVAWSPDGTQLASASQDGTVRLWSAERGELLQTLFGLCLSVAWSPDGTRLAMTTYTGDMTIWSVKMRVVLHKCDRKQWSSVRSGSWSPNGMQLALSTDNGVGIWTLCKWSPTRHRMFTDPGFRQRVFALICFARLNFDCLFVVIGFVL